MPSDGLRCGAHASLLGRQRVVGPAGSRPTHAPGLASGMIAPERLQQPDEEHVGDVRVERRAMNSSIRVRSGDQILVEEGNVILEPVCSRRRHRLGGAAVEDAT